MTRTATPLTDAQTAWLASFDELCALEVEHALPVADLLMVAYKADKISNTDLVAAMVVLFEDLRDVFGCPFRVRLDRIRDCDAFRKWGPSLQALRSGNKLVVFLERATRKVEMYPYPRGE